jgi:phosphatidate cytidylyltransferase
MISGGCELGAILAWPIACIRVEIVGHEEGLRGSGRLHELGLRTLVALIAVPLVALVVLLGSGPSALLFGAAAGIGCSEYYRLTLGSITGPAWVGIAAAVVMPLSPALLPAGYVGPVLFGIVAITSMLTWTGHLLVGPRATAPERAGHVMAGLIYSSAGLVALSALRSATDGIAWTAVVLVATWANDTAAYLVGKALGRSKLWPAVSPGKTWEGLLAGLCGGVFALNVIRPWLPRYLGLDTCFALGAFVGVVAPVGDLCKSMLKRAYHVKDASHLLPGHGGMLDRIDGILFVAPIVWIVRVALFPH